MTGRTVPDKEERQTLETAATCQVGKTTVIVARVFREKDAETLGAIILRLMKKDGEKP